MVRPKTSSKKPQKRGVDFKKYKRKLGRKLPPPKNATNTEIKSKAIILPEQSVASERVGLAVSRKGLTLKELLQHTSHHNAKVRKDALIGIKDLASKHPDELKLHKLAMIEKLRERISDEDKGVRETLYQLFKSVIFPGCKEDIPGPIISLIMAYIFNAMTHLAFEIRLMAFKFFELIVQYYPSSFLSYAEKILQNYEDVLKKNHNYLRDKGKLKIALAGLVRCLSLLPLANTEANPSYVKNTDVDGVLHAFEPEIPNDHTDISVVNRLEDLMPVLVNCFRELTPSVLAKPLIGSESFECMICVLHSIDHALKYFISWNKKFQTDSGDSAASIYKATNVTVWGETKLLNLLKKMLEVFPLSSVHNSTEKNDERDYILNVAIADIFLTYNEWMDTSFSVEKVLVFVVNALYGKICCNSKSSKAVREKHILALLPFIPKLVSRADVTWKSSILEAFTEAFKNCKPESPLKLACLSVIEEMLIPSNRHGSHLLDSSDPEIQYFQIEWIRYLPLLLIQLGDQHSSSSKIVLHLHLRLGQHVPIGSLLALEYDKTQYSFTKFYCEYQSDTTDQGGIHYGPFIMLPRDCQEYAVCSLYYFSSCDSRLLAALTYCCLCPSMDPFVIIRIIEILEASYKAGHIQIGDLISFLVTLLTRFRVNPEGAGCVIENDKKELNRETLRTITSAVCSCLSQMGDNVHICQILQKITLYEMSLKPPLDNMCAMLRALALLGFRPTHLSEQSVTYLATSVLAYMVDCVNDIPDNTHKQTDCDQMRMWTYYLVPCFILFDKSDELLKPVLNMMGSLITDNKTSFPSHLDDGDSFHQLKTVNAVASILIIMHRTAKMQQSLSQYKVEIRHILRQIISFQSSNNTKMSFEERHKILIAFDKLKMVTCQLHCWDAYDLVNT